MHHVQQVAGDGQELGALEAWYARDRGRTPEAPLLIGSVKSNMGHCEGCSGLAGAHSSRALQGLTLSMHACSTEVHLCPLLSVTPWSLCQLMICAAAGLIKILLSFEHGLVPPNLHFQEPNPNSKGLIEGIMKVRLS